MRAKDVRRWPWASRDLASRFFALALCLAALSGCGGVARGDKKTDAMSSTPATGGSGGAGSASLLGSAGSAGSAGASAGAGGTAGLGGNQGGSAGASADAGSFACGATTCAGDQICVQRQCGGGPVQCMAETDGGCPAGWQVGPCVAGQFENQSACVPEPCTPPASECVDTPASCTGALDCFCLNQSSVCQGPGCQSVVGRHVTCNGAE